VEIKPLPAIEADLALIKQVISNLLSNAVKFSGKKEIAQIEIGSLNSSDDLSFYIKDNGTGFDMKYVHDLFGVFKRLDNAADFEGTGVGLALAKRIIDKHGGRIWADSEPGKGATFCFAIPKTNEIQI
jgi:light-regulated signal transduction histidine kinase (bacteriophytochrome)